MRKKTIFIICISVCLIATAYYVKCMLGFDISPRCHINDVFNGAWFTDVWTRMAYAVERAESGVRSQELGVRSSEIKKENTIIVSLSNEIGGVNRAVCGNNILGHWTQWGTGQQYADFGAGLWDVGRNEPAMDVIAMLKQAGVRSLRFPGGCGTHSYDWKKTIEQGRDEYLFGLNEFLQVCSIVGAEPVITVSYFTGTEQDAADMVEYLNALADEVHPWALKRKEYGHPEPYGVKYFEIGNEVYHGDHKEIKSVAPDAYADRYLKYYEAMKSVDLTAQIGAVLHTDEWNRSVTNIIKGKIDFGIVHWYPTRQWGETIDRFMPKEIFDVSWARSAIDQSTMLKTVAELLKTSTGRDVPLAVTEFNGGFVQEKPVPYRFTLGNALVNAELINVFMIPDNNVLFANHWNFVNEYWGMIANGFQGNPRDLKNAYYKRPNYYVFEMYAHHFGDVLIRTDVQCESYDIAKYQYGKDLMRRSQIGQVMNEVVLPDQWQVNEVVGVEVRQTSDEGRGTKDEGRLDDGRGANSHPASIILTSEASGHPSAVKSRLLSVVFGAHQQYNYYHISKHARVKPDTWYRVTGFIKADNLQDEKGVCLEVQDDRGWPKTHSAVSTERVRGTTDWQYVRAVYKSLPDASGVRILVRRVGETEPFTGTVQIKDVKLEEWQPDVDTKVPYLSVNASKSGDEKTVYLMVINKNMDRDEKTTVTINDFMPDGKAKIHYLWGKTVDATNEHRPHDDVRVYDEEVTFEGNSFEYTFKKHSLTAIVITGKSLELGAGSSEKEAA